MKEVFVHESEAAPHERSNSDMMKFHLLVLIEADEPQESAEKKCICSVLL